MAHKVDNAIILAAGTASRFAPLSYESPKALLRVRGEVLIERQIRQLQAAGIRQIILVVGYGKEQFAYLQEKFGVILVENPDYATRNNNASIYAVRAYLKNSYICSSDNYFGENPFESTVEDAYYAAVYAQGETKEWCLETDETGRITAVTVGGRDAWYMLGHVFWDAAFSRKFLQILLEEYDRPETADKLWESIYMAHLQELDLKIRKYSDRVIFEFDTLDELREFDPVYKTCSGSRILQSICKDLGCREEELSDFVTVKGESHVAIGFRFTWKQQQYQYFYKEKAWEKL